MRFPVFRSCELGLCPHAGGACACPAPNVEVDVDELTPDELDAFRAFGSEDQQGEILDWLAGENSAAELLAGQRVA